MRYLEYRVLLLLVAAITLLFGWILWPFAGAILWALVLAILFFPLNQRLLGVLPGRQSAAALISVVIIILMVILPAVLLASLLAQEIAEVHAEYQSGQLDLDRILRHAREATPNWAINLQDRLNLHSLSGLSDRIGTLTIEAGRFLATRAIIIGQSTIRLAVGVFLALYLLFYLLRDGQTLKRRIDEAIPLRAEYKTELASQFVLMTHAIVRGTLVIAMIQGALGGFIFWLLGIRAPLVWAAFMAVLSLLPVLGTGLVWIPTGIYLIVSGSVLRGGVLLAYGVTVIEMANNLLRPRLVGKGTQVPDCLVLITTLGGISVLGVNGFVIGPVISALFLASWHVLVSWQSDNTPLGESKRGTAVPIDRG